ncbi:hypothetical protein D3C71_1926530 [compost metagenome]
MTAHLAITSTPPRTAMEASKIMKAMINRGGVLNRNWFVTNSVYMRTMIPVVCIEMRKKRMPIAFPGSTPMISSLC